MYFRLGIFIGASLLLATAEPPDPSDYFCASFTDPHKPCGCTISQKSSYDPTCGSDGVTYLNECFLECRNVIEVTNITVQHSGACTEECTCKCTGEYDPTCGTDNVTYSNKCILLCAAKKDRDLWFQRPGACDDYSDSDEGRDEDTPLPTTRPKSTTKQSKSATRRTKSTTKLTKSTTTPSKSTTKPVKTTSKPAKSKCVCSAFYGPVCGNNNKSYVNFCVLFCVSKVETDVKFGYWGQCAKIK